MIVSFNGNQKMMDVALPFSIVTSLKPKSCQGTLRVLNSFCVQYEVSWRRLEIDLPIHPLPLSSSTPFYLFYHTSLYQNANIETFGKLLSWYGFQRVESGPFEGGKKDAS